MTDETFELTLQETKGKSAPEMMDWMTSNILDEELPDDFTRMGAQPETREDYAVLVRS